MTDYTNSETFPLSPAHQLVADRCEEIRTGDFGRWLAREHPEMKGRVWWGWKSEHGIAVSYVQQRPSPE